MTQIDFGHGASLYTLEDELGQTVQITDLGATIVSIQTRDKDGLLEDVVLGYSCAQDYLTYHSCQGATIGRYANRIRGASFVLNDVHYHITPNEGTNHLHGGNIGLSKKMWKKEYYTEDTLVLSASALTAKKDIREICMSKSLFSFIKAVLRSHTMQNVTKILH